MWDQYRPECGIDTGPDRQADVKTTFGALQAIPYTKFQVDPRTPPEGARVPMMSTKMDANQIETGLRKTGHLEKNFEGVGTRGTKTRNLFVFLTDFRAI